MQQQIRSLQSLAAGNSTGSSLSPQTIDALKRSKVSVFKHEECALVDNMPRQQVFYNCYNRASTGRIMHLDTVTRHTSCILHVASNYIATKQLRQVRQVMQ